MAVGPIRDEGQRIQLIASTLRVAVSVLAPRNQPRDIVDATTSEFAQCGADLAPGETDIL
jgi:hypothetical protein